jgi:hypothetical protein
MTISWGHRNRFRFSAAGTISAFLAPPGYSAVFAITYKQDSANRPKAHTVLYFGESADVSKDVRMQCQNIRELWLNKGGNDSELYVFYHAMPSSTAWERAAVQAQLVSEYDPLMNSDN